MSSQAGHVWPQLSVVTPLSIAFAESTGKGLRSVPSVSAQLLAVGNPRVGSKKHLALAGIWVMGK